MALTTKVLPIRPMHPLAGGQTTFGQLKIPMTNAAVLEGDCIEMNSGLGVIDNSGTDADSIVGFAAATVPAAVGNDFVMVYPTLPGAFFEGTMIAATDTDATGTAANADCIKCDIVAATVGAVNLKAYACLDQGTTAAPIVHPLFYTRQIDGTQGPRSGVGKTNPRMAFVVRSSVFCPFAA